MIEKLLRRFVSGETEFVLKAMEQVGGNPDVPYRVQTRYGEMFDAAMASTPRKVDRVVLSAVSQRLKKERKRREAAAMAQTIAAKILMGDDFKDPEEKVARTTSNTYISAAQIQQLQGAQQQMYQQMQQAHAMQRGQTGIGSVLGGLIP